MPQFYFLIISCLLHKIQIFSPTPSGETTPPHHEACGGWTRPPVASQIAVVIPGPPGVTWWHFVHGADISRSYDLAGVHSTAPRLADVSILSAPGCRAGHKIILQQLPHVVIVPPHPCSSAVYGAGAPLRRHVSFSCRQMLGSSSLKLWRSVKKKSHWAAWRRAG